MQAAHRVAKNTLILYARMAITVFISLYSTRLVLAALGVSDFGLFNVVGGVISMLGFLNASMAAATQRFISFAQGARDPEKVKRIFNMSSLLHWGIAILVFIVLEIAGYFFFNGIFNIAPDRVGVAKLIYQFMVVSTLFTVISVPYEAVITSHENMMVYAILGIVEAVLKLAIAFYITYSAHDHLVLYGLLMAILSIVLLIMKRIYCHRNYPECELNFKKYYDPLLLKEVRVFAGWSLLGSSSSMVSSYGQGILMNIFFGTIVNTAQSIANQISGQLGVFAGTLQKALNPSIDKSEGAGNRDKMIRQTLIGSKFSFFLLSITFLPVLIEMPFILKIWLDKIPPPTIIFCRLLLIRNLIEQFSVTITTSIAAVGNISKFQRISSLLNIIPLISTYIFFSLEFQSYFLYVIYLIYSLIQTCLVLYYAKVNFEFSPSYYFKKVIFPCIMVFLIAFITSTIPFFILNSSGSRLISTCLISLIITPFLFWHIGLTENEKKQILGIYSHLRNRL